MIDFKNVIVDIISANNLLMDLRLCASASPRSTFARSSVNALFAGYGMNVLFNLENVVFHKVKCSIS